MTVRSSSVSLPHFSLSAPFICFHLPSARSVFIHRSLMKRIRQSLFRPPDGNASAHNERICRKLAQPYSDHLKLGVTNRGLTEGKISKRRERRKTCYPIKFFTKRLSAFSAV